MATHDWDLADKAEKLHRDFEAIEEMDSVLQEVLPELRSLVQKLSKLDEAEERDWGEIKEILRELEPIAEHDAVPVDSGFDRDETDPDQLQRNFEARAVRAVKDMRQEAEIIHEAVSTVGSVENDLRRLARTLESTREELTETNPRLAFWRKGDQDFDVMVEEFIQMVNARQSNYSGR